MRDLLIEWLSPQGIIAFGMVMTAYQQWYNRRTQKKLTVDMKELAINTNSIKDALVAATAISSRLEGEKSGREAEIARQENLKP